MKSGSAKEQGVVSQCPVCRWQFVIPVFNKAGLPCYVLERHYTRKDALAAKTGDVDFYFCLGCQFAFNNTFDSSLMDYLLDYESSRTHSEYIDDYLYSVCGEINDIFPVTGKTVVEIGCGDGHLLMKVRELFEFKGWGEPSLSRTQTNIVCKDIKFVAPESLKKILPQYVLITNPSYKQEIKAQIEQLGIAAKVEVVQ